ncbi:MAG: ABC transporter transmembrane domain-containing protein [Desulfovibrionaceae bacterium]|nr:ABC transporter transmembrane domain-containing protein [Desulfovibrionaceae bacterium]
MCRVFRYFLPYKWAMLTALLASGLVSVSTAGTAWLIKPALDEIFFSRNTEALLYVPLAFIGLTLIKGLGRYIQNLCMHYSALRVLETLRKELFHRIILLPLSFYEDQQVGSLMSRVINDVAMIRQSLPAFVQILRQILTMLGLLFVVFEQNFNLACWALVVLPLAGVPFAIFSRALRRYGRKTAEVTAGVSGMLQELLSGIRVIKAFATEKNETERFDVENGRIISTALKQTCVSELSSPVMELIGSLGIGLVIWYGGREVISGNMTPGTFFSFMAALVMLYDPFKALNGANMSVQNALAGAERVFAIIDDPKLQIESGGQEKVREPFQELCFEHVSLSYGDQSQALTDICLTVRAGERVALVGPSGAGKTSLVNLIPRFYVPSSGRILLNGIPVEQYELASLRRSLAVVSQDAFLFDMSLRDNIAYGQSVHDQSMDRILKAAEFAYADSFIQNLPDGYDTMIGERGVRLSGGQKQRVTIARALIKNAPLLILDEATSALDSESEQIVQKALDNLMRNRTSLIIAHRLSTILEADRIIVMDKGRIVDSGRHEELLGRCELYTRLYDMQFKTHHEALEEK